MHEYSIVSALIGQVEAEAARRHASRVHRLRVQIGELAGVELELLRTAYMTFRERTICEVAELDVELVEARWICPGCGCALARGSLLQCSECERPARLVQGDEIVLERIEMEVDDHV